MPDVSLLCVYVAMIWFAVLLLLPVVLTGWEAYKDEQRYQRKPRSPLVRRLFRKLWRLFY